MASIYDGLDVAGTGPAASGAAPADIMPRAEITGILDSTFGPKGWRFSGEYRSRAREDQLRAQGAQTVAPSRISAHSLGTQQDPGAYDVIVPGLSSWEVADRLNAGNHGFRQLLAEGAHGGQGSHLHLDARRQTTAARDPYAGLDAADPYAGLDAAPSTAPWSGGAGVSHLPAIVAPPVPKPLARKGEVFPRAPGETDVQYRAREAAAADVANPFADLANLVDLAMGAPIGSTGAGIQSAATHGIGEGVAGLARSVPKAMQATPGLTAAVAASLGLDARLSFTPEMRKAAHLPPLPAPAPPIRFVTPPFVAKAQAQAAASKPAPGPTTPVQDVVGGLGSVVMAGPLAPVVMAGQGAAGVEADANRKGIDTTLMPPEVANAAMGNAVFQGAMGSIPVSGVVDKFVPAISGKVAQFLLRSGFHIGAGAGAGASMTLGEKGIERSTFDPNAKLTEGLPESAAQMAALNLVFSLLHLPPERQAAALDAELAKPAPERPAGPPPAMPPTGAAAEYAAKPFSPPEALTPAPGEAPQPVEPIARAAEPARPGAAPAPPVAPDPFADLAPAAPQPKPGDEVAFLDPHGAEKTGAYVEPIEGGTFHRIGEPNGTMHEIPTDDIVGFAPASTPAPEAPTMAPEETHGVQGTVSSGNAGTRPAPVQRPAEGGGYGGAPAGEVGRGAPPAGPAPGERAPVAGGLGQEPNRAQRGAGAGDASDAGVPGAERSPAAGDERYAAPPHEQPAAPPEYFSRDQRAADHVLAPGEVGEERGPSQKARDNLEAIRIAKALEAEKRPATPEERTALARYVGWGGLAGAFEQPKTGRFGTGFEQIGPELKRLMTPEEYATAARSTQYAHYTAEHVIRSMWQAAQDMGFKGGKVFEPGMGVGHFKGMMPPELAARSHYTGLEMDPVTAKIAKALYPSSTVREGDYTKTPVPEDSFDLVIGNPPFSDTTVGADQKYAARKFMLHDYFFAKSMDSLRPGGLMGFVTSAGTMNKIDTKARRYLAERAEFVGGVRLPSSAFKQNAGTEVTTDILFFKKHSNGLLDLEKHGGHHMWTGTVGRQYADRNGELKSGQVNRYFDDHPEQVLGEPSFADKLYAGRYAVQPRPGQDLPSELREALGRLPKDVMEAAPARPRTDAAEPVSDFEAPETKQDSYYVKAGQLMQYRDGVGRPVQTRGAGVAGGKTRPEIERIKDLVPLRDIYREVVDLDVAGADASAARGRLHEHYDAFTAKHGAINKAVFTYRRPSIVEQESARAKAREATREAGQHWREGDFDAERMAPERATLQQIARLRQDAREAAAARGEGFDEGSFDAPGMADVEMVKRPNVDPFIEDPESYRLRSIEDYNDDTHAHAKRGVFFENQIAKVKEPELHSAADGVLWSLNQHGRLDLDAVAQKMGRQPDDLVRELGDSVYQTPEGDWQTAAEYLSGDVLDKLAAARSAAIRDPSQERNVIALEKARPALLPPSEITMTLGMPWIPADVVSSFARDKLQLGPVEATHNRALGGWKAHTAGFEGPGAATYGTPQRTAVEVLQMALNRAKAEVRVPVMNEYGRPSGQTVVDPIGTQALQDKIEAVKAAFADYIGQPERADALAKLYNETMNRVVKREFDGSYLTTPGMSSDKPLRPHQKRVVARTLQTGNTYMAHAVGSGKTMAMAASAMEMRRLGLAKKPMIAVPDHMLGQFTKETYEAYPNAKLMVADEHRFRADRRKQFIANVANTDLDIVIITHTNLGMIPTLPATQRRIIERELDRVLEALGDPKNLDRFTRKDLEAKKEALEQRMHAAFAGRKDSTIAFEQMGVDFLFVDEAHLFRKLEFATQQRGLKGISPEGSQRAWDLYSKIDYLEQKKPGHSHVLASGTPITNTMGELYTISRYLQNPELERRGIGHFDSWAATYGDVHTGLEQTAHGTYEPVTRFSKFVNIPELYKTVAQVMDIVTGEELGGLVTRPKLQGGKRQLHLAPLTDFLSDNIASLAARATAIKNRGGKPEKGDDIILNIINDGRLAAIDPRFVDPWAGDDHPSKLNMMLENVAKIYHESKDTQFYAPADGYKTKTERGPATQMIFSDLGIHGTEKRPFSGYAWMKKYLIAHGVNPKEIAFIGDYKNPVAKQRLFNDMNTGKIRILVGSVAKMGVGTNAHVRLLALHNLDPHWYPANDEQRVGRIVRYGNMNPEVQVHDYSTKGTYDATMWEMMGRKARFTEQFLRGDPNLREMDDVGEAGMFEQLAAMTTTDPRVKDLTDMRQELDRVQRRRSAHDREQYALRARIEESHNEIGHADERIAATQADIARRVATRGDAFTMKVGDQTLTERPKAIEALKEKVQAVVPGLGGYERAQVGELGGFPISVRKGLDNAIEFEWRRANGDYDRLGTKTLTPDGVIRSMEDRLAGLEGEVQRLQSRKGQAEAAITAAQAEKGKVFEGGEEVAALKEKIAKLEAEITPPKPGQPADIAASQEALRKGLSGSQMTSGVDPTLGYHAAKVGLHYGKQGLASILGEPIDKVGSFLKEKADAWLPDAVTNKGDLIRMALNPMAAGDPKNQVEAKAFANAMRAISVRWDRVDKWLNDNFTREQRERMWAASDEHGVLQQQGIAPGAGQGLNRLTAAERAAVEELHARSLAIWRLAQDVGLVDPNQTPLPAYVPRMLIALTAEGKPVRLGKGGRGSAQGVNLTTTTPNLKQRKYLTTAETEAAAAKYDPSAVVVQDIRTLGLALKRMERAIAGQSLVSKIEAAGRAVGVETVKYHGVISPADYFTIDHPALTKWMPALTTDPSSGAVVPKVDQNGRKMFEPFKMHITREFEGPLKAVLQTATPELWRDLMLVKGGVMSVVMFSPLMHNAVIWGKALPTTGWKAFGPAYFEGYAAKKDPATMDEAVSAGLVPIGRRFNMNEDVTSIAEDPTIRAGRSWVAQLAGAVPKLYDRSADAGEVTRQVVDKVGDVWHNTLLWDRIGDLQMFIYKQVRDTAIREGLDPAAAQKVGAHFANRYAGALPMEAMSKGARLLANLALFSRSFTLGNTGAYKDVVAGLPQDIQAQILHESGAKALAQAQGITRRKSIGMFAMDVGFNYLALGLAAGAVALVHKWMGDEGWKMVLPWDNEPGKANRVLIGFEKDGTGIYIRLPTGKVAEDLVNWATHPIKTLNAKLNPFPTRVVLKLLENDAGFGKKIFEEDAKGPWGLMKNVGRVVWDTATNILPEQALTGVHDLVTGDKPRATAALQALGPIAGITTSRGYPGGPAGGILADEQKHHEFAVQEALPGIRVKLLHGDLAGARKDMNALRMTRDEIHTVMASTIIPESRQSRGRVGRFTYRTRGISPDDLDRFKRARAAAVARRQANVPAP